jgi:thiol-disulfide isomerase/thioredoxin
MGRFAALAAVVLTLAACTRVTADPGTTVVRHVADPLPTVEGPTLDGDRLSTDELLGSVLVINVWASWCAPCEQEQPELVELAERYRDEGVRFLGINHQDQEAAAREFARRFDVPYPSIVDPGGRYAAKFGYLGLPDTYVVDAGGTIRIAINGPKDGPQLSAAIDEVLAAGG